MDVGRTEFEKCFEECGPSTPVFFILSPGVNPVKDVETLGTQENHLHETLSLTCNVIRVLNAIISIY